MDNKMRSKLLIVVVILLFAVPLSAQETESY
jgi:hypothetical protein